MEEQNDGAGRRLILILILILILLLILILIPMNRLFDHEKLEVYQESLAFVAWLEPLIQKLPKSMAVLVPLIKANSGYRLHEGDGD